MDDKFYIVPDEVAGDFSKVSSYTCCEYEGHLYNQGITMCSLEHPNNADITRCGPECPCYSPKTVVSVVKIKSASIDKIEATFTITNNGETFSEKD